MPVSLPPIAQKLQSYVTSQKLDLKTLDTKTASKDLGVSVADIKHARTALLASASADNEARGSSSAQMRDSWQGDNATSRPVPGGLPPGPWRNAGKPSYDNGKPTSDGKPSYQGGKPTYDSKPSYRGGKPTYDSRPSYRGGKPSYDSKPSYRGGKPTYDSKPA
jgi:hypothetical protein